MSASSKIIQAAAGNAAGEALYVEDVFSTYLYTGNSSTQTITNGIDLDGEGGLVWAKLRDNSGQNHALYDTERGVQKRLDTDRTVAEYTEANGITSFNSDGWTTGSDSGTNYTGLGYASWTFRKAPKFFDVVTYTGNGTTQDISHNLGSVPGMIIIKETSGTAHWIVGHRSTGFASGKYLLLSSTAAAGTTTAVFNSTDPTSSVFTLGDSSTVNNSGDEYVAYLFAHNDDDGEFGENADQDIIKCGSYNGSDHRSEEIVDVGFEPQWVLIKAADTDVSDAKWHITDNMRGATDQDGGLQLWPHLSDAEGASGSEGPVFRQNGFYIKGTNRDFNRSGSTYIYIAIRRGPMKTPESGTEVFAVDSGGNGDSPAFISNFPVDLGIRHPDRDQAGNGTYWSDRLRGDKYLKADSTAAETTITAGFDQMDGFEDYSALSDAVGWMFRRAPGFFDVVAYEGNGGANASQNINHNLGVTPELMIVKAREDATDDSWFVYSSATGASNKLILNSSAASASTSAWASTAPTDSVFTAGNSASAAGTNQSGIDYIAYLFATVPGVSKVGSYEGDGTNGRVIDCGFSSGARFVLIRNADLNSEWHVFDTERGIVAGNDPRLELNTTDAEATGFDHLDPDSSGFIVNGTELNPSSGTIIFLAIA